MEQSNKPAPNEPAPGKPAAGNTSDESSAKRMRAAASLLYSQMQELNAGLLLCMRCWEQICEDPKRTADADYNFRLAMKLAEASARTGEALARLKTGTSHHIKVERLPIPQKPASAEETLSARQALKGKDNSESCATKTGGKG
jgi:hypothetical protein